MPPLYLKTNKLYNVNINENDVSIIINNIDSNKTYGWDNLSVKMIKLCVDLLIYSLKSIFGGALQEGKYPDCWKNANVVAAHKKESTTLTKNYRPFKFTSNPG